MSTCMTTSIGTKNLTDAVLRLWVYVARMVAVLATGTDRWWSRHGSGDPSTTGTSELDRRRGGTRLNRIGQKIRLRL